MNKKMNKKELEKALVAYNNDPSTFDAFQDAMLCSDKKGRDDVYKRISAERWTPHVLELCRRIMTSVNGVRAEGDFDELFAVPLIEQTLPLWFYMAEFESGYIYRIVGHWNRVFSKHTPEEVVIRDKIIDFIQCKVKWALLREYNAGRDSAIFLNENQIAIEERRRKANKAANTRHKRQFDFQRAAARNKRRKASAAKKAAERTFSFLKT